MLLICLSSARFNPIVKPPLPLGEGWGEGESVMNVNRP